MTMTMTMAVDYDVGNADKTDWADIRWFLYNKSVESASSAFLYPNNEVSFAFQMLIFKAVWLQIRPSGIGAICGNTKTHKSKHVLMYLCRIPVHLRARIPASQSPYPSVGFLRRAFVTSVNLWVHTATGICYRLHRLHQQNRYLGWCEAQFNQRCYLELFQFDVRQYIS